MIDNNYLALKQKVFSVLNNGLSIVSLADKLNCTPAALQLWLDGEDNADLNSSIYAFLAKEKIKDELLDVPLVKITPFNYIEKVVFEATQHPGVYALIGNSGIGKTAALLECIAHNDTMKFLYSPEELYKPLQSSYSVICIDNAEHITVDQADIACQFIDKDISIVLSGNPNLIKKISQYDKLALKTVIRDVPGIDHEDVKKILETVLDYEVDEILLKKIDVISIPSVARLVLLLREAYRIMKSNKKSKIDLTIISEAKKSLIMEGSKW